MTTYDVFLSSASADKPSGGILERAADPPAGSQALRAAVEDLFPRLKPGELPTPVRLGNKLRSLRGRVFDGAAIRQGSKQQGGMTWRVERSGGDS